MYSSDNRGYAPPAKLVNNANVTTPNYNLYGYDFNIAGGQAPYWTNFLSKYVTKTKVGYAANGAGQDAALAQQNSIFWACPAWSGYMRGADAGGIALTQTGYGMNGFPEFTASYPPLGKELGEASGAPYDTQVNTPVYLGPGWSNFNNKWYKLSAYTHPAERALTGDCIFWFLEARPPLNPPQMAGQFTLTNAAATWGASDRLARNYLRFLSPRQVSRHQTRNDRRVQSKGRQGRLQRTLRGRPCLHAERSGLCV